MIVIGFYLHGLRYVWKYDAKDPLARQRAWDAAVYWIDRGYQVDIKED